eukprot:scaffold23131_cov61-Phaeocystis_antarctica.AAC.8
MRGNARAERTANMLLMSVTLDVSKLSGWLNACAPCRVASVGARCGPGDGRCRVKAVNAVCAGRIVRVGAGHVSGAHEEYAVHDCDAGRVEAQRLIERCTLPSRKEERPGVSHGSTGGRCGVTQAGRRENPAAHERQRTRGAHRKHHVHVRDAGHVEAQRLVERLCTLPSRKERRG